MWESYYLRMIYFLSSGSLRVGYNCCSKEIIIKIDPRESGRWLVNDGSKEVEAEVDKGVFLILIQPLDLSGFGPRRTYCCDTGKAHHSNALNSCYLPGHPPAFLCESTDVWIFDLWFCILTSETCLGSLPRKLHFGPLLWNSEAFLSGTWLCFHPPTPVSKNKSFLPTPCQLDQLPGLYCSW